MEFKPLQKRRLFEEIIQQIQLQISEGHLKPGDKLPSERELSQQLTVSRTSVREAVRILEIMGYVEIKIGEGVFIKEVTLDTVLSNFTTAIDIKPELIYNSLDVRDLIEVEASRRAAIHATEEDLEEMEKLIIEAEKRVQRGECGLKEDEEFHLTIARATKNQVLELIMHLLADLLSKSRGATLQIPGQPIVTIEDHKAIYDAIKERDAEKAAQAMKKHIDHARNFMLSITEPEKK